MNSRPFVRRTRRIAIAYSAIAPLLALADTVIILVASVLGGGLYQLAIASPTSDIAGLVGIGLLSSLAYTLSARYLDLYSLQSLLQSQRQYWRVLTCVSFAILLLAVILFLLKVGNHFSRGSVICFIAVAPCLLISWRILLKGRLKEALAEGAIRGRRALVVGHDSELTGLTKDLLLIGCGLNESGRIVLRRIETQAPEKSDIEAVGQVAEVARATGAEEILLCVSWGDRKHLDLIRDQMRLVPLPVHLLPDSFVRSIWARGEGFGTIGLIEIQRAPLSRTEQIGKRLFDVVTAGGTLIVLSPLMIATAIALKLQGRGPVIFRQRRRGFNGREFEIYKFCTMTVLEDGPEIRQAERYDPRVTAVGRILRRTSIDELPQLFNVLQGQMSIVGPRPHAIAHDEEYATLIGNYAFRHHMKPGITGWAQIHGHRGGTPRLEQMQRRIEQDLWYINNWSLGLDLSILIRTCIELLRPRNAY
jgi:undecaprenyl-phosphate galactose phosphotransferase/putative colanic acid biosynthesis UDP-glucose lipid carrier transferase